ncbi:MAG: hypothetical protein ABEJ64_01000 [Candidatus Nanohaloarchaea archaeon]
MTFVDTAVLFIAGLAVGGLGIYTGTMVVSGNGSYRRSVLTALLGSIAWAVFSYVPFIGSFLALVAWIAVINHRHEGGWLDAALMGLLAWVTTLVVLYLLSLASVVSLEAVGIPGA